MTRGGHRKNAGRKPLHPLHPVVLWVVKVMREELHKGSPQRYRRAFREQGVDAGTYEELEQHRTELNKLSLHQRAHTVADPFGTKLEDVQTIFALKQVPRWGRIPPPSDHDIGRAACIVAQKATAHWGRKITPRMVRAYCERWLTLEKLLSVDYTPDRNNRQR